MGLIPSDDPLASIYVEAKVQFSAFQYLRKVWTNLELLFAYPVIVLSGFGLLFLRRRCSLDKWIVAILSFVAIANCVFFWRSVYIHIWWLYYFAAPFSILAAIAVWTFSERFRKSEPEEISVEPKKQAVIVLFVAILVMLGTLPRLSTLHKKQIKMLPGDKFETALFIKNVAKHIESLSSKYDVIFTNLPAPATGRILPYYAKRKIIANISDPEQMETLLQKSPLGGKVFFLFWQDNVYSSDNDLLHNWLSQHTDRQEFVKDGYQFDWFVLVANRSTYKQ